jgi:hypothetical protein
MAFCWQERRGCANNKPSLSGLATESFDPFETLYAFASHFW